MGKEDIPAKSLDYSGVMVIGCRTVFEEIASFIPAEVYCRVLDAGLHKNPEELKTTLQHELENVPAFIKYIILGYGMCSGAVIGLKSSNATLVIPRIDDCIGIFAGSKEAYRQQQKQEPGTYYLTKGWLKTKTTVFDEFEYLEKRYGTEKAKRIIKLMLKNYTRLCFIETGVEGLEEYRSHAREYAESFGLRFETIKGSDHLIRRMIYGPWDGDFLVKPPGQTVELADFYVNGAL